MSDVPRYRFTSAAQWNEALYAALGDVRLLDPAKGKQTATLPAGGIVALAAADKEVWYVDRGDMLSTDGTCGPSVPGIRRLVVGQRFIWALAGDTIMAFDRGTLQMLRRDPAPGVVDIATDAHDGLWLLDATAVSRIDANGRPIGMPRPLIQPAMAIAAVGRTVLLLNADGLGVVLMGSTARQLDFADALEGLVPDWGGFTATGLIGGGDVVLATGQWGRRATGGTAPGFILISGDGSIVSRAQWQGAPPDTITFDDADLLASFSDKLVRFARPLANAGELRLTPALETETPAGGWLRADVEARLANEATLTLRWAAIDDASLIATLRAVQADARRTAAARIAAVAGLLRPYWSLSFRYEGEAGAAPAALERFSFPLHTAAPGSTLWIELRLDTHDAASASSIATLTVIHDTDGLMANLPAIYRGAGDADGTMRRLVGVLEATTQELDDRIANLASRLDPDRTEDRWLPSLAAMFDLPFDAALTVKMQRRLVQVAPALLEHRGTRTGLATLLEAIFPNRPVRIIDRGMTLLAITLGASTLPALLAGPAMRVPKLNARLVLGRTALCAVDPCDDGLIAPAAEVVVTVPATAQERRRFGPALQQMLEAMTPADVRLVLRWAPWIGGMTAPSADILTIVDAPMPLRIGGDRGLGTARLGGRREPRIASDGIAPVGHRLM